MKRSLLFLLMLTAFTNTWSQEKDLHVRIDDYRIYMQHLNADIAMQVLDFNDACLDDAFGILPVFIYRFQLSSDNVTIAAKIIEEHVSLLEYPGMQQIADIELVGNEFKLISSLVYQSGVPFAEILILPFRETTSTGLTVLDSCVLHIGVEDKGPAFKHSSSFVDNSVLATGSWFRIATDETGIYRITYEDLTNMGISPASLDPEKIRIFGNGNGIVPEKNSVERLDDLLENSIYVYGEEDGVFDEDDYILFYGQSSIWWNYVPFSGYGIFTHDINPYTDKTYYFLNINDLPGKRIPLAEYQGLSPTVYISEFSDYAVHENDTVNILKTGREWYGELFSEQTSYEYSFNFPNISEDYKLSLMTNIAAHSTTESNYDFYYGEQHLLKAPISKIIIGTTVYAWTSTPDTVGFYPLQGDNVTIRVDYDKPVSTSTGWMNYIAINARRKLIFTGPFMPFRDHLGFGPGEVAEYKLSGAGDGLIVWDVTDPFNITRQSGDLSGDKFIFLAPADEIQEFIAFDGSGFNSVEFIEQVENQNLHAYDPQDYIILTHPDFMEQAQRMLALHRDLDQIEGFIVTPQKIYNEFGSGKQDPAAIRDFVRMLYEKADPASKPKYLLLLGDASYDFKDRVPDNTNFVPAYQSLEALKLSYSFVTDDFFGLLDPGDGLNAWGKSVEIGIGRFPVHTVEQADAMVDKVESYLTMKPNVLAPWRNDIYFIADYGDQNTHFTQAEKLQQMVDTGYQEYNRLKIYVDAFPEVSSSSGNQYPEVNNTIDHMMGRGGLIVNYTGHGGERGWSKAGILDIPMINSWTNRDRLPLFITATCEFSRYDDPSLISAGELVFLNPGGGSIGLLTTSRLSWADPNFRLNKAIYKFMFKQVDGEYYRIGDIIRLAKTDQNNGTNIKNFVLLGDPAMQLVYPEYNIETTVVNGIEVEWYNTDTLNSLSEVNIQGVITDLNGDTVKDFNGIIYPKLFDKDVMMSTLGNDLGSLPAQFYVMGQKLYDGKVSVAKGVFSINLFMPENMVMDIGYGKVSYYAYDTVNHRDANGYYEVYIGGVNPDATPDHDGPEMNLYMNNTDFVSGGLTDSDPVFLAYLFDEHGVNFTGNGIGRDITLTLDHDPLTTVVINDIFDPDLDSYQSGWISFPYSALDDGIHTLTLKAWDNMNNASEETIKFEVSVNGPLALTGVRNYPNPFSDITHFVFDHNKPGNSFDLEIRIFNINGQHVRTLRGYSSAEG
ncbi:MAG: type IX secretion system sortase PorU, partial [Bacteroidales bacterium]|nr:type IX secretion system sortase PorU [Bacteroidales bacterium]